MDKIKIQLIDPNAKIPVYQHNLDSGCDLFACENYSILPGERKLINTGISLEIPEFLEAQIRPRSGLALKHGITVLNTPGTIDAGYRGLIKVLLINQGDLSFHIHIGDRIAQMVFVPVFKADFQLVNQLESSSRDSKGFGSTGVN